ncbi:hypothetical protein TSUD_386480 [Trifolium subterraneum]|uniref:Uncharacterized protein n=1 Tax=Trifolium subterraneum TaxID=3900 RepID=A0A2Z6MUM6_TRISU|nr:hypothetical protein TSUD_386480 [Trifolium subterraneum]
MLLFNTNRNGQQVTIRIIPRLQFHNHHQTIISFVSPSNALQQLQLNYNIEENNAKILTFDLELLLDHNGLNSKSELSCIIPRGKPFNFPEVVEYVCNDIDSSDEFIKHTSISHNFISARIVKQPR